MPIILLKDVGVVYRGMPVLFTEGLVYRGMPVLFTEGVVYRGMSVLFTEGVVYRGCCLQRDVGVVYRGCCLQRDSGVVYGGVAVLFTEVFISDVDSKAVNTVFNPSTPFLPPPPRTQSKTVLTVGLCVGLLYDSRQRFNMRGVRLEAPSKQHCTNDRDSCLRQLKSVMQVTAFFYGRQLLQWGIWNCDPKVFSTFVPPPTPRICPP